MCRVQIFVKVPGGADEHNKGPGRTPALLQAFSRGRGGDNG